MIYIIRTRVDNLSIVEFAHVIDSCNILSAVVSFDLKASRCERNAK
jgi:hypothetical protein